MSASILIVDDERDLLDSLAFRLEREGYRALTATTRAAALATARRLPVPDLVLLDWMLPDMPGTEVCRALRGGEATRSIPIVMVSARSDEIDRVVAFELGADDYVTKPFSVRELLLRIRAVLRRSGDAPPPATQREQTFQHLRIDHEGHRVWVDGAPVELTALEFKLLATLVERRDRIQTRETLLDDVWASTGDITTRTVDTHVQRLRKKLGPAAQYIQTLRGVGYRFVLDE